MTDPLERLRLPEPSTPPDPAFARWLRARLEDSILRGTGGKMSTTDPTAPRHEPAETSVSDLAWGPDLRPYLGVSDARAAIEWYVQVFEGKLRGEPYVMPDGTIGHAEVGIGDSVLALAEYGPSGESGEQVEAPAHTINASVPEVDATVRRAVETGADLERSPSDEPYGRVAAFVDPFGHRWLVMTPPRGTAKSRPGDTVYLMVVVEDRARAVEFYGAVLGSRVEAAATDPVLSLASTDDPRTPEHYRPHTTVPVYHVADVDAALERVRAGGGRAEAAADQPYGRVADCFDPEGNHFVVWQPLSG